MVECLVWDQDAAGSSPVVSTTTRSGGFFLKIRSGITTASTGQAELGRIVVWARHYFYVSICILYNTINNVVIFVMFFSLFVITVVDQMNAKTVI